MSETKQVRLSEEQEKYLQYLEVSPELSPEVISLVREDFVYGLTKEQVQKYVKKGGDVRRMKLHSECLRKEYGEEIIDVLINEDPDIYRCQLAVEFYGRGIPILEIKKIMKETENASEMQKLFQEVFRQKEMLVQQSEETPPYARQLLTQIQDIVGQIQKQESIYGQLQRAVSLLEASKREEEEREHFLQEIRDLEVQIASQQDELNKGHKKVAQQRADIEKLEKENESMKETIAGLEAKLRGREDRMKEMKEKPVETEKTDIPVYYSVPVMDRGKVVGSVQVEHNRKRGNAPKGFWARLCGLLMPSQDIVKDVIEAGLDEQQLVQIRIAMEKGLTEEQLKRIINPALSPQKMSEVIELAVLVNENR